MNASSIYSLGPSSPNPPALFHWQGCLWASSPFSVWLNTFFSASSCEGSLRALCYCVTYVYIGGGELVRCLPRSGFIWLLEAGLWSCCLGPACPTMAACPMHAQVTAGYCMYACPLLPGCWGSKLQSSACMAVASHWAIPQPPLRCSL